MLHQNLEEKVNLPECLSVIHTLVLPQLVQQNWKRGVEDSDADVNYAACTHPHSPERRSNQVRQVETPV